MHFICKILRAYFGVEKMQEDPGGTWIFSISQYEVLFEKGQILTKAFCFVYVHVYHHALHYWFTVQNKIGKKIQLYGNMWYHL